MAARRIPYVNKFNGNVLVVTKQEAKKLNEDWTRVEFTTNEEGKRVMRIQLNGATVDVSENEDKEAVLNGVRSTK